MLKSARIRAICGRILLLVVAATPSLRADFRAFRALPIDSALGAALAHTAEATLREFPKLTADNLALSVINLTEPDAAVRADYHGDAPFYPASLIKLFFMVETFRQEKQSPEVERALREMIRLSDNDATAYLVDVISGTTGGPELKGEALQNFIERRRAINEYFVTAGYDISAMMKPWSFGPYGREMQLLGGNFANRNRASGNSFASLLHWIVRRRALSASASDSMLALLERPLAPPRPDENQVKDFFGESLPVGSRLWSKSGETSEVRHDAAYVELPDGRKLIVVILTRGAGEDKALLPAIGRHLLAEITRSDR